MTGASALTRPRAWSLRRTAARTRQGLRSSIGWAAKASVAGVLAWMLAGVLVDFGSDFYAPLVAVLTVQPTVARTLRDSVQRLLGVALGLGLGYLTLVVVGVHWWSLALVLLVSMTASTWRRLGMEGAQVPIAALLMLLLASDPQRYGESLLAEGVVGVVTAALVNLVVVPPLHVRDADAAIRRLRAGLGDVVTRMADDVEDEGDDGSVLQVSDWSSELALVDDHVQRARAAVDTGSESVRLNPRARPVRAVPEAQRQTLLALEHAAVGVREIGRVLGEAADEDQPLDLEPQFRPRLARALRLLSAAVSACGDPSASPDTAAESDPLGAAAAQVEELERVLASWDMPGISAFLAEGALVTQLTHVVRDLERAPTHRTGQPDASPSAR
jgi:hypothetical protein